MLHLFRIALAMLLLGSLSACMKPSDLADGADYYLRDAGVLDHSASQRSNNRRIQADSFIYIGQGPFVPPGYRYARPNVVAEQAFEGFVEYFRWCAAPRRRSAWTTRCARRVPPAPTTCCTAVSPGATTGSATGRSGKTKRNSAGSGAIAVSSRSC